MKLGKKDNKFFTKTYLDEQVVLCDKCNQPAKREEVFEVRSPTSSWILHQHRDSRKCGSGGRK